MSPEFKDSILTRDQKKKGGGRGGGDEGEGEGEARRHQNLEEARKDSPLDAPEGMWSCQYLDLWPPEL